MEKIILGTVQLGLSYGIHNLQGKPSLEEAFSILNLANSYGIKFLDTSDGYGDSQKIIGDYLKQKPVFEVLTKFVFEQDKDIKSCISKTLRTLNAQNVFSYSYHRFQDYEKDTSITQARELITEGKILHLGVSVYGNDQFEKAINDSNITIIQFPFNVIDNWSLRGEMIKKAKAKGKILHVRSVYLQGVFHFEQGQLPTHLQGLNTVLDELHRLAKEHKLTLPEMALLYNYSFDEIDGVLIGVEQSKQLEENFNILKRGKLPPSLIESINQIKLDPKYYSLLNPATWAQLKK